MATKENCLVKISHIHPNGHYVVLVNTSDNENVNIGGAKIFQKCANDVIKSFQFPDGTKVEPRALVTVWGSNCEYGLHNPPTDFQKKVPLAWGDEKDSVLLFCNRSTEINDAKINNKSDLVVIKPYRDVIHNNRSDAGDQSDASHQTDVIDIQPNAEEQRRITDLVDRAQSPGSFRNPKAQTRLRETDQKRLVKATRSFEKDELVDVGENVEYNQHINVNNSQSSATEIDLQSAKHLIRASRGSSHHPERDEKRKKCLARRHCSIYTVWSDSDASVAKDWYRMSREQKQSHKCPGRERDIISKEINRKIEDCIGMRNESVHKPRKVNKNEVSSNQHNSSIYQDGDYHQSANPYSNTNPYPNSYLHFNAQKPARHPTSVYKHQQQEDSDTGLYRQTADYSKSSFDDKRTFKKQWIETEDERTDAKAVHAKKRFGNREDEGYVDYGSGNDDDGGGKWRPRRPQYNQYEGAGKRITNGTKNHQYNAWNDTNLKRYITPDGNVENNFEINEKTNRFSNKQRFSSKKVAQYEESIDSNLSEMNNDFSKVSIKNYDLPIRGQKNKSVNYRENILPNRRQSVSRWEEGRRQNLHIPSVSTAFKNYENTEFDLNYLANKRQRSVSLSRNVTDDKSDMPDFNAEKEAPSGVFEWLKNFANKGRNLLRQTSAEGVGNEGVRLNPQDQNISSTSPPRVNPNDAHQHLSRVEPIPRPTPTPHPHAPKPHSTPHIHNGGGCPCRRPGCRNHLKQVEEVRREGGAGHNIAAKVVTGAAAVVAAGVALTLIRKGASNAGNDVELMNI